MYKATVILIALIILAGYLFFSKPGKVVVNEKGKVEGIINKSRALLQQDKFWKYQLQMAYEILNDSLLNQIPSSSEMQALYQKLRVAEKLLDEKMKPLYTEEEQMARILRIKADSLERAGKWRIMDNVAEEVRMQKTEKVRKIINFIETRIHKEIKPSE